jgi:protein-disulfide isomerase
MDQTPRWRIIFDALATTMIIVAAGFVIWNNVRPAKSGQPKTIAIPSNPISIAGAPVLGSSSAPIVIVEFSDFQCPFCGRFARESMPELVKSYVDSGKVRIAFKNLPLSIHPLARGAAEAAVCAQSRGRFWQFHDLMFAKGASLEPAGLAASARSAGVDDDLQPCIITTSAPTVVDADVALARALGIPSTPSFLFGTASPDAREVSIKKTLAGAQPPAEFAKIIDELSRGLTKGH